MDEITAFNFTLKFLKRLSTKTFFNKKEISYIDYAPLSILSNRFNYDKNILNDFNFAYPIICTIEKAIGELISRTHNISEYTFYKKNISLNTYA